MQALPSAAYFLFLEAAVGGVIALFWLHSRDELPRGFLLFTGVCLLILGGLGAWLRFAFPPLVSDLATVWFASERTLSLAFGLLLTIYLVTLRVEAWRGPGRLIRPLVPLVGLGWLWSAALVDPNAQLGGLGVPLAVLAGAMALGSALVALSLGHWYLISPRLSTRPLIAITFLCLGALVVQLVLLPLLVFLPGLRPDRLTALFGEYVIFFGVRVVFGLVVPVGATVMAWRTARIRSLDSATGLLYIVVALVLAGEIAARTLFFLTGVVT
ncbi:MAG TPA: hypothetical protein VGL99_09325 [Chloroflexota bacterium]